MSKKPAKTPRVFKRRESRRHDIGWIVSEIDPDGPSRGVDVFESFNEGVAQRYAARCNEFTGPFHYQVRTFKNV